MKKYAALLKILDAIRVESSGTKWEGKCAPASSDDIEISQARCRAFIHLYLKVMFGLTDFSIREEFITDGPFDGGIDGYYIDRDSKRIFLIQSKFRQTERNFECTQIRPEELLVMEIDRITGGEGTDGSGNKYNGKIAGLIRRISEIPDIARYSYHVAILANCKLAPEHVRRLTGGYRAEVFDFQRCYNELIFPILSGTYFQASDLTLHLDLNNKSAGAKTSYAVSTPNFECEITVLFVPTLEIAKAMEKYRNSILEYNPRSYLDSSGQGVNASIRETLLKPGSNEFALMNNGVTILSDETNFNERIGQQNKAQLRLLNPQIINGGQTACTLSRILQEDRDTALERFAGKEVLVKVITLTEKDATANNARERRRLIDEISAATNRQTSVTNADRHSNESAHIRVQKLLFDRYGLLYERKRGEFSDGVFAGYINKDELLERNLFLRILLAVRGDLYAATLKKIFITHGLAEEDLIDPETLDAFYEGYEIFQHLAPRRPENFKKHRDVLAKVYLGVALHSGIVAGERIKRIEMDWERLLMFASSLRRQHIWSTVVDRKTGEKHDVFSPEKWIKSSHFAADVKAFVQEELRNDQLGPPTTTQASLDANILKKEQ